MPKTVILQQKIDYNDADDEFRKKRSEKRNRSIGVFKGILLIDVILCGGFLLFSLTKSEGDRLGLIVIATIIFIMSFVGIVLALVLTYLVDPLNKLIIDEEKMKFIKEFDELDESIKITDYKIYPKEMYFEVSINKSRTYFLLTKKKLYYITYTDEWLRKKNDFIKNNSGLGRKNAFITLFNNTNILNLEIEDKDIDYIMTEVRNITIKVID